VDATSVVLKFGSSVLADRHCLPRVVHEIYRYIRRGHHVLAVVSAIGNETDRPLAEVCYWSTPPALELAVFWSFWSNQGRAVLNHAPPAFCRRSERHQHHSFRQSGSVIGSILPWHVV
jgi:hypothetical protein